MNVREVTDIVLKQNGGKKFEKTCDQLMAGSWEEEVKGVATTFMATVDVIRAAIDQACNLIITHEPTWFTGMDKTEWVKDDSVYYRKKELIDKNKINIWRYHDHMHGGTSDQIYDGLLETLGWKPYLNKNLPHPHCYTIPPSNVRALAEFLKQKLGMEVVKILGNPDMKCQRVGILVGGGSLGLGQEEMPAKLMHDERLEVIVCGEITEWTLPAYVRDAAALGLNKALIIAGHERSEEPGMKGFAGVLQPLLPGIPVKFIDSGEPFTYL
jgi:putative NIF3 family GTP cyclohydrolase 1 type 2